MKKNQMLGLLSRSRFSNGGRLSGMAPKFNDAGDLLVAGDVTLAQLQAELVDYVKRDGTTPLTGTWTSTGDFDIIAAGSIRSRGPNKGFFTGTGDVVRLFHNATDAFLDNGSGGLSIRTTAAVVGGNIFIDAAGNFDIHFRTNNVLRGFVNGAGDWVLNALVSNPSDNAGFRTGIGGDLRMLHNGVDSLIINITGKLKLTSTNSGVTVPVFAGDATNLEDGAIWYNSATNKFRGRAAGVSVDLH